MKHLLPVITKAMYGTSTTSKKVLAKKKLKAAAGEVGYCVCGGLILILIFGLASVA